MSSYHLTIEAEQDLRGIYQRGLNEFGVKQADAYFDGLINRFDLISKQPLLYPTVDHIRAGYRRSVYGRHAIYYKKGVSDILIVRVLGSQKLILP
ncbi:MAG: type II toxin-antitoxin system RelE/ParE family toxin [Pseudomonadota bacterium]